MPLVVIDAGHGGGKLRYHTIKDITARSAFTDAEMIKQ